MDEQITKTEVLTTADVAHVLRLSTKTVGEMMRSGQLPAMRIGGVWRVRREALEEWMKNQEQAGRRGATPTNDCEPGRAGV